MFSLLCFISGYLQCVGHEFSLWLNSTWRKHLRANLYRNLNIFRTIYTWVYLGFNGNQNRFFVMYDFSIMDKQSHPSSFLFCTSSIAKKKELSVVFCMFFHSNTFPKVYKISCAILFRKSVTNLVSLLSRGQAKWW